LFSELVLMFQKEVAQRIVAKPSSKAYGRLSILTQWLCDVKLAFDVPASAFTPPPKITSSIVRFVPKTRKDDGVDFKVMEEITAAAFGQRRKMIRGSLKNYLDHIKLCGLNEQARAEELSVNDFIALAKSVTKARL
jgi:16S rRNA (adenine1518-N6/adenine1519-N6)-dimethyltransferase